MFNPFARGRMRVTQLLGRFTELNRRMHNKLFVADGQVAVVGGRNLTDDYFGLGQEDRLSRLRPPGDRPGGRRRRRAASTATGTASGPIRSARCASRPRRRSEIGRSRASRSGSRPIAPASPIALPHDRDAALAWLEQFRGKAVWGPAELVYDDPNSVGNPADAPPGHGLEQDGLRSPRGPSTRSSPRTPTWCRTRRRAAVRALRARGVKVRMLTNSLATTDEVPVNAHYANTRPELAELGVELYEMKPCAASRALYFARPATSKAHLALHGKAAVFDRKTVFVGSFNLDPRSADLDTETVFVVHSPTAGRAVPRRLRAPTSRPRTRGASPTSPARATTSPGSPSSPARPLVEPHDPASVWRRFVRSIERVLPIAPLL